MKNYKRLYKEEQEQNAQLKLRIYELKNQLEEKEVEPYSVDVVFDERGDNFAHIDNVVNHKTNYKGYPDCRAENWIITTADGLTSVFDYDKVVSILAYREDEQSISIIEQITQNLSDALKGCNK